MVEKVTDPLKVTTDPALLGVLSKQGVDPAFVEFVQDYAMPDYIGGKKQKGKSPYTKFYKDLKSGKNIMVSSALPMVNARGKKCKVGFIDKGGTYVAGENQFELEVTDRTVLLRCINDQIGKKEGDYIEYSPRFILDGVEVHPTKDKADNIDDPTNQFYSKNCLVWDYGKCIRRIRIIEGAYYERWITNYRGIHEIIHTATGNLPLHLGYYLRADETIADLQVDGNTEILDTTNYPDSAFPVEIGTESTFNPAAGANSPVDGHASHDDAGADMTWATLMGAAGDGSSSTNTSLYEGYRADNDTSGRWQNAWRNHAVFDTSPLPDNAEITIVAYAAYGTSATEQGGNSPTFNIYNSMPTNDNAIVNADYASAHFGATPYCDTPIAIGNINVGTPGTINTWTFNATGRATIDKTGLSRYSFREVNYVVGASAPPNWGANEYGFIKLWSADQGAGYKPKLFVTYYIEYTVSSSVSLGLSPTVSRLANFPRTSTPTLGFSTTVSRSLVVARSVSNTLGLTASVVRDFAKVASTPLGLTVSASRALEISRASSVTFGLATAATRFANLSRTVSTTLGLTTTVSRAIVIARSSVATLGLETVATRLTSFLRTAGVTLGLYTLAVTLEKIKRRISKVGTNQTIGDVGTNRNVTTEGFKSRDLR